MQGSDNSTDKTGQSHRPLTFAEYAQEFLRRNPRYRAAYRQVARVPDRTAPEQEVMGLRWGLRFPLPSRQASDGRACTLASIGLPDHRHP